MEVLSVVLVSTFFVVFFVSCVGGLIMQQIFFSRLRRLHTSTWEQLGRPVIFLNSGLLNTVAFFRFMWRREYESLGNQRTVAIARFLRALLIFYAIFFPIFMILFYLLFFRVTFRDID
jgi:hypothetical protein